LAGLTQLTRLDLSGCTNVRDLNPLAGLTQLTSLDLTDSNNVDISALDKLNKLRIRRSASI
jgi:Leucine-rich repeat (LRR) protein